VRQNDGIIGRKKMYACDACDKAKPYKLTARQFIHVSSYFFAALTFAHLALFAALIRARTAAEK
jgi:hypothetical protein